MISTTSRASSNIAAAPVSAAETRSARSSRGPAASHNVRFHHNGGKHFDHAVVGALRLNFDVLMLAVAGLLGTLAAVLLISATLFIPIRALNRIAPAHLLAAE